MLTQFVDCIVNIRTCKHLFIQQSFIYETRPTERKTLSRFGEKIFQIFLLFEIVVTLVVNLKLNGDLVANNCDLTI